MKRLISCELNIGLDTAEGKIAKDVRQRSALDYLIYNASMDYAELVMNGNEEGYWGNIV